MTATIRFRPGFLDRLQKAHGFQTETALAGAIGVSAPVLNKAKRSGVATAQILAGISQAFGYGLGEIAYVEPKRTEPSAQAA
jgi:hypothetical protein